MNSEFGIIQAAFVLLHLFNHHKMEEADIGGWISSLTVERSRWLKLASIFIWYLNCILCFVFCRQPNRIQKYSFSRISANRDQAQFPQNTRLEKCIPNSLMSCGLSSLPVYGPANQTNMVSLPG